MNTAKLPYEPGTRYSNSLTYDVATTEVVHGWQVFEQRRPDGTPTGVKSFVNHRGALCGICVAEMMRKSAAEAAMPEVLKVLREIEAVARLSAIQGEPFPNVAASHHLASIAERAAAVLTLADGVRT